MTDFSHLYDQFTETADRLETLQHYAIPADNPSFAAFRNGTPRPETSIRTSPWLERMAAGVLAGKQWRRVRLIEWPLTEYTRWELLSYAENQVCGEQIRLLDRERLDYEGPDLWCFDLARITDAADQPHAAVGELHYTPDGAVRERRLLTARDAVLCARAAWNAAWSAAVPLNEWLAEAPRA